MMEEKRQEEIERYLHNEMSVNERNSFENNIQNDEQLKEDVLLQMAIHEAFDDKSVIVNYDLYSAEEKNKIKKQLRTEELKNTSKFIRQSTHQFKEKQKHKIQPFLKYVASIAAIFLIVLAVKFTVFNNATNYYEQYADWDNLPSLVEKGNEESLLVTIENLYQHKEYAKIITSTQETSKDPYILIYKGVSYVKLDDFVKAEETFNALIASNTLESSRGYWYKLLLYLKDSKIESAKKTIALILQDTNNYNYQKAAEISTKLNSN